VLATLVVIFAFASCGGDSGTTDPFKGMPSVKGIRFNFSPVSVEVDRTRTILATFTDSTGQSTLARSVTWSVADSSIAKVSSAGVVTGIKAGTTYLIVTADKTTVNLSVEVTPPVAATITFAVTSYTLGEGETITIPPPTVVDRKGGVSTDRHVRYTTTSPDIINVVNDTLITGKAPGSATLTAWVDTVSTNLTVTVTPLQISQIRITPAVLNMGVNQKIATSVSAYNAKGEKLTADIIGPATYTIDNPAVANFPPSTKGVVAAVGPGKATLTVNVKNLAVTAPISVARLAPAGFTIDVHFVGTVSPAVQQATMQAVERWEQVISAPLIPYHIVTTANLCGKGTPAVDTTVTNLMIIVLSDSIDGRANTVGSGGPCIIRDDAPMLTALGTMTFDSADVVALGQQGILVDMITHEIGHILGIGTFWGTDYFPNTATGIGGVDPVFTGRAGRVASFQLGFTSDSALGVPIENTGGDGTKDAHWRATVFGHELMTGTLHYGKNPLSLVTIEALADFGYTVVPEAADDISIYTANNPSSVLTPSATLSMRLNDSVLFPRYTSTRNGLLRAIHRGRNVPVSDTRQ
jgi:hypothetical protein